MSRAESIGFQTPMPVYFLLMQYHYEMPSIWKNITTLSESLLKLVKKDKK
jgi:hypothetical protein